LRIFWLSRPDYGEECEGLLANHLGIAKLSFTGSTARIVAHRPLKLRTAQRKL
jgi:hypothetical protein